MEHMRSIAGHQTLQTSVPAACCGTLPDMLTDQQSVTTLVTGRITTAMHVLNAAVAACPTNSLPLEFPEQMACPTHCHARTLSYTLEGGEGDSGVSMHANASSP